MSSNQKNHKNKSKSKELAEINAYFGEFELAVRRKAGAMKVVRLQELDDFVQYMLTWAWGRPDLVARYVPRALAAVSVSHRAVEFFRKEARGFPQGSYDPHTGTTHNAIWYLDHVVFENDDDVFTLGDTLVQADNLLDDILTNERLAEALRVLTPAQQYIYVLVEGLQYKVVEVADMLGYKREWTQRELGKARHSMAGFAQSWQ